MYSVALTCEKCNKVITDAQILDRDGDVDWIQIDEALDDFGWVDDGLLLCEECAEDAAYQGDLTS
jgi:hypothetical protein